MSIGNDTNTDHDIGASLYYMYIYTLISITCTHTVHPLVLHVHIYTPLVLHVHIHPLVLHVRIHPLVQHVHIHVYIH